jgi:hypothetical protein
MVTFGGWLQTLLINDATVGYELSMLAKKPSSTILTFQGYEINGNTFYTVAQDKKSTFQNSGVRFDTVHDNGTKDTYFGYIEEIWELDYRPSFPFVSVQMGQADRRRGKGRPVVRNDNGESQ